jgi:hypothetical protein
MRLSRSLISLRASSLEVSGRPHIEDISSDYWGSGSRACSYFSSLAVFFS